jgi:hypothetical protein
MLGVKKGTGDCLYTTSVWKKTTVTEVALNLRVEHLCSHIAVLYTCISVASQMSTHLKSKIKTQYVCMLQALSVGLKNLKILAGTV